MPKFRRMNKHTDKETGDKKEKSSRKEPNKKKGKGGGDDDSVDSKGNIRDLIAYDDEETSSEEESFDYEEEETPSSEEEVDSPKKKKKASGLRRPRKAALKARKKIQRRLKKEDPPTTEESEEEEEDESSESEEDVVVTGRGRRAGEAKDKKKKARRQRLQRRQEEEEEEESTDESETLGSQDTDEEEEEDEDYEDGDEEEEEPQHADINIHIGSFGSGTDDFMERMIPKRYNMKKESKDVRNFVKLVTKPYQGTTIDDQIDQFKALNVDQQKQMLEAMERKPPSTEESLMFKVLTMKLPPETQTLVLSKYHSLQSMDNSSGEYFKLRNWLEKVTSLPLGNYKEIPVKIEDGSEACTAFMERAKRCLNEAVYGQDEAKLQILQFIAAKIANPSARGLSLLLVGPPGIGKTSLIKGGIAKALGWPFQFISLGGDSDATTYTGHQVVYEGSHSGKIANSLATAKSMSMVLMFDELDKISTTSKGEEVQNMLIHLTDPVQNSDFEDKYLSGIPLDLSHVMFVFSANDINKIDKVLLDRMMVIQLKGYKKEEKIAIAENFLIPGALREVNLVEKVGFSREVVEHILNDYAGEETGVRELKRCVEQIIQKINVLRIFNNKELPFHIPNFTLPFVIKKSHIDLFLKKKQPQMDESALRMYS